VIVLLCLPELDWGVCHYLALLSNVTVPPLQPSLAQGTVGSCNENAASAELTPQQRRQDYLARGWLEDYKYRAQMRVVRALQISVRTMPRSAPHFVWAAAAPAFATVGQMEELFTHCEVTEEMMVSMAAQIARLGKFKEAISLLERNKSYSFPRSVHNALLVRKFRVRNVVSAVSITAVCL
jgi:hypothetical protein